MGVAFYGQALHGKLPPLSALLAEQHRPLAPATDRLGADLDRLSDRMGIAWRPASPEALAALERLRARDGR